MLKSEIKEKQEQNEAKIFFIWAYQNIVMSKTILMTDWPLSLCLYKLPRFAIQIFGVWMRVCAL